jgi:predicted membrane channel-forming protein YqfA (hemolysin III family)
MNTQKNLMMFTIVISAIYGVWAIFAPGNILSTYGTPEEFINPVAQGIVMLFGVAAWVVALLGWHIRENVTEENIEKAMSYFALAWLLYGLHGVLAEKVQTWPEGLAPATFSESTIGGIVFLVFSVIYYMLRKPKSV